MQSFLRTSLFHIANMALIVASLFCVQNAMAEKIWNWSYTASNIVASGTLTTSADPDSKGFYQIYSITGHRNGDAISGLHPSGSSIPGNEPYELDNLIRIDTQGQITTQGFGFSTESGNYANPFFAAHLTTPVYMEVYVTPMSYCELPISFSAKLITEPDMDAGPRTEIPE